MTVPQKVKLARHPADLDDDGHEYVELGVTTETDTSLVLSPDGSGGVEWVTGGGSGGAITPGSITTVTDDTKYNAWPVVVRLADDSLILGYTKADSHHSDNTGKAVKKVSTDDGATWSSETTIYDDASDWVELTGLLVMSTGRIIASYYQDHVGSGSPVDGAFIVYSDDDGATWSSPVTVNSSLSSYSYGSGRAIELASGDLLQCVEGKNSGDTFNRMVVLKSTDDGATWGSQVTIATGTRNYYEAIMGVLDDSSILVLLRTSDGDGDIYQSTSTDDGATWSTPTLAFAGHGQPNWIQHSNGTLVAITRENDGSLVGDVGMYTSADNGASWSAGVTLDGTMYEMEYGCPVELDTGDMLVAYGYQPSSSTANSDIKQIYLAVTAASGAPADANYLVGTASADLSNEIVVGTTPGGDLGGTWAAPVVEAVQGVVVTDAGTTGTVLTKTGAATATWSTPSSGGTGQHILLADGHSTPFSFNDLLQMDDGSDFMWSDS